MSETTSRDPGKDLRSRADARLDAALTRSPHRDPRPGLRAVLKALRGRDPATFEEAIRHFEETLIPAVAGEADPLGAWLEYARVLARLAGEGRAVAVDGFGRAKPAPDGPAPDALVLHLPDDAGAPAVPLQYPRETTPAQEASIELLVLGRVTASAYD
ncbi:MAG TPA: hypothetical protein VK966_11010 [Longimicrobiales bacterium]|nr:hypothetical protein [Longimicrobiales bacterium]